MKTLAWAFAAGVRRASGPGVRGAGVRLLRSERGSVTVEHVLWFPIFAVMISLAAEASMAFHTQARLWDVARDLARLSATGQITPEQAQTVAAGRLPAGLPVDVAVADGTGPGGAPDVIVTVTADGGDATLFGLMRVLPVRVLSAQVTMRREV